jgi:serine/threonine protein kinase
LAAKLEDLYKLVKEKDIEIEVGDTTKLLGAGAFGRVYSALWKDAPVAVKIFKPETGSSEDVVNLKKAVEREAYTLDGMKDPLVLQSYGIIMISERERWLVMDKAKYGSLMSFVCRYPAFNQLPLFFLFSIFKDISGAVAHLHSHGVTHKDIKGENVLLHNGPYEFCVKLCDFGLSKRESMGTGNTIALTMKSMAGVGTLAFMAPELQDPKLAKKGRSSAASDVYAICVTFIQILLRCTPNYSTVGYQSEIHEAISEYFM